MSGLTCHRCGHTEWGCIYCLWIFAVAVLLFSVVGILNGAVGDASSLAWLGTILGISLVIGGIRDSVKRRATLRRIKRGERYVPEGSIKPDTCPRCAAPMRGMFTCRQCGHTRWTTLVGFSIFLMAVLLGGIGGLLGREGAPRPLQGFIVSAGVVLVILLVLRGIGALVRRREIFKRIRRGDRFVPEGQITPDTCVRCGRAMSGMFTCLRCGYTRWTALLGFMTCSMAVLVGGIAGLRGRGGASGNWHGLIAWAGAILGILLLLRAIGAVLKRREILGRIQKGGKYLPEGPIKNDTCIRCGRPRKGMFTCRECGYTRWATLVGFLIFSMAMLLGGFAGLLGRESALGNWHGFIGWAGVILGTLLIVICVMDSFSGPGVNRQFSCPHCGKSVKVGPEASGATVSCPNANCARQFQIPLFAGSAKSP